MLKEFAGAVNAAVEKRKEEKAKIEKNRPFESQKKARALIRSLLHAIECGYSYFEHPLNPCAEIDFKGEDRTKLESLQDPYQLFIEYCRSEGLNDISIGYTRGERVLRPLKLFVALP